MPRFIGSDCVAVHTWSEESQLAALPLFLPSIVQTQDGLIHHAGKVEDLVDLIRSRDPAVLIAKGNGDFGLEESLLFVCTGFHTKIIVSKLIGQVNY